MEEAFNSVKYAEEVVSVAHAEDSATFVNRF
jgi:hypothetical protein